MRETSYGAMENGALENRSSLDGMPRVSVLIFPQGGILCGVRARCFWRIVLWEGI